MPLITPPIKNIKEVTEPLKEEILNGRVHTIDEMKIFSRWANNDVDSLFTAMWTRSGLEVHFGYHNSYTFPRGKAEAEYEDFIIRLQTAGFIIRSGVSNDVPTYKITKKGYDFAKTLPLD